MENLKIKHFMYLDDDAFKPWREPVWFLNHIHASNIAELYENAENKSLHTNVECAQGFIERNGCPDFISFDNDLGRDLEGIDLAKWLVEQDLDKPGFIPERFRFFVHSQNIVAAQRIRDLLNPYLQKRAMERALQAR